MIKLTLDCEHTKVEISTENENTDDVIAVFKHAMETCGYNIDDYLCSEEEGFYEYKDMKAEYIAEKEEHDKLKGQYECFKKSNDMLQDRVKKVIEIVEVQCSDGNYDQGEYMRGMANGMLVIKSILTDSEPEFKESKE